MTVSFQCQCEVVCQTSLSMHLQVQAEKDEVEIFKAKESAEGIRLGIQKGLSILCISFHSTAQTTRLG